MQKELLICIVNDPRLLEPMLEGFLEAGISGATVIDSRGMGQILSNEIPIFTGLKTLFPGGGDGNHMIFSVMASTQIDEVIPVIQDICGHFEQPGIGVYFTIPVTRMAGFRSKAAPESKSGD